jgi:hypothetical protein
MTSMLLQPHTRGNTSATRGEQKQRKNKKKKKREEDGDDDDEEKDEGCS